MERTMDHVAAVLVRFGCGADTSRVKRCLRDWARKGLLPPLSQRGRGRGQGKLYFWSQRHIVRWAFTVYDLLEWHGRTDILPLPLWVLGYDVPAEVARAVLLNLLDMRARAFAGDVASDEVDELGDRLSELAVRSAWRSVEHKGKQVPRWAREHIMETMLNVRANPAYDLSEDDATQLLQALAAWEGVSMAPKELQWGSGMAVVGRLLQLVRTATSLQRGRSAVASATEEELRRVQQETLAIVGALRPLCRMFVEEFGPTYGYNCALRFGLTVVPALLALRQDGYGALVDWGVAFCRVMEDRRAWPAVMARDMDTLIAVGAQHLPSAAEVNDALDEWLGVDRPEPTRGQAESAPPP
jgi:hypothetical protein